MGTLTELGVKSAKEGMHGDGDGLMLVVRASGRKSWLLRYQMKGVRRDMGLGRYPEIGLKEARHRALDARRLIGAGSDPIEARQAAHKAGKPIPTFGEIAALVIADAQAKTANGKVRYQCARHLGPAYSGPLLDRSVNEITTVEVAAALAPIWRKKPEVARKTYPAIRRVFDRARIILRDEHGIAMNRNPAEWSDLKALGFDAPRELSRGHHPSLPYDQTAEFMTDLRGREAVSARALEFLILANVRTDAVLKATWEQFDLDAALWTVPLASLKDREHRTESFRVPLSPGAVEIVREMEKRAPFALRVPGHGRRTGPLEYGVAHAAQAHELGCPQVAGQRRSTNHGARVQGDVQNMGRGSRHRPACRRRTGDGPSDRNQGRARLSPHGPSRKAPRTHERMDELLRAARGRRQRDADAEERLRKGRGGARPAGAAGPALRRRCGWPAKSALRASRGRTSSWGAAGWVPSRRITIDRRRPRRLFLNRGGCAVGAENVERLLIQALREFNAFAPRREQKAFAPGWTEAPVLERVLRHLSLRYRQQ